MHLEIDRLIQQLDGVCALLNNGQIGHLHIILDDIRPVDEISELKDLQRAAVENKELSLGKLLVDNLSYEHFDPSKYLDVYSKELEKLIETKVNGRVKVAAPQKIKDEETKDLVTALKAFLQNTKGKS